MSARNGRTRLVLVFLLLLVLHFYVRPRFGDSRAAPDFLAMAVLLFALRSSPGDAAVVGLCTGLLVDALTPARFGASALAHTVIGYLASWGRAVFFADNLVVTAGFFAIGTWIRNLLVLVASGTGGLDLLVQAGIWSTLQALTTAVCGTVVLVVLRGWLDIRIHE
ncbi:MAG: rod shape-determining protein MreD [Gemmatimonadales bacterium]